MKYAAIILTVVAMVGGIGVAMAIAQSLPM